jgi:hypothetical protein
MEPVAVFLWGSCSAILLLILLADLWSSRRRATKQTFGTKLSIALAVAFAVVTVAAFLGLSGGSFFANAIESKGGSEPTPWGLVGAMYAAMLIGIVAQTYYFGDGRSALSWIKPALASPIIFIPLISSYQSSLSSVVHVGLAELMMLLVSFQNGFFWKVIFDKQAELLSRRNPN